MFPPCSEDTPAAAFTIWRGTANTIQAMPGNYKNHWEQSNGQAAGFPSPITLAPGEARQFSLAANAADRKHGGHGRAQGRLRWRERLRIRTHRRQRRGEGNQEWFQPDRHAENRDAVRQHHPSWETQATRQGPGIYMSFGRWGGNLPNDRYLGDSYANYTMLTNLDFSKAYWNEPPDLPSLFGHRDRGQRQQSAMDTGFFHHLGTATDDWHGCPRAGKPPDQRLAAKQSFRQRRADQL